MTVRDFRWPATIAPLPSIAMLLVVCLAVSGCADLRRILDFKHQAAQAETIARIHGRIDTEGPVDGNLVVVLARVVEGQDLLLGVDSYVRVDPGSYAFSVPAGSVPVGDEGRNPLGDDTL